MKFIHIADLHLDMPLVAFQNKKEQIKKRRLEQKEAFRSVINIAREEMIDALFIAGDLFEHKYVENDTIQFIISSLKSIPDINVFITPGNHDPLIKNSPYDSFEWPSNVTIFRKDYGLISLEDADVYGVGFENYEMDEDIIPSIKIEDESKINILITHGDLNSASHKYHDIKERDLSKFDYVALGHIHLKKVDDTRIIYPGSLNSCGFDEPGEHGYVIGEVTKEKCDIRFVPLAYKKFEKIEVNISNDESYADTLNRLKIGDDFYEIKLIGARNYNVEELIMNLRENNENICVVKDQTILSYDLESIASEDSLKGKFTKKILLEMENMSDLEKAESFKIIEEVYKLMD